MGIGNLIVLIVGAILVIAAFKFIRDGRAKAEQLRLENRKHSNVHRPEAYDTARHLSEGGRGDQGMGGV